MKNISIMEIESDIKVPSIAAWPANQESKQKDIERFWAYE